MEIENFNLAFFNLGPWEILLILMVILILFGARRLPELARGLGKGINEFRDAVDSSKKEIVNSLDTDPKDNIDKDSEE
jgi:sec-independent protein translocase protein TatA